MIVREQYLSRLSGHTEFVMGDEAAAMGAIFSGCSFFGGYPITPASEVAEVMARELPRVGGFYVQFEDEIASISGIIGAAWSGARSMTATSGPGFSLMQEAVGYAVMTETPCVVVDVQRSGPSTGQATKPAQGDIMQARWGTHGDHEIIAVCPWSVQECFDLVRDSFSPLRAVSHSGDRADGRGGGPHPRTAGLPRLFRCRHRSPRPRAKKGDLAFGGSTGAAHGPDRRPAERAHHRLHTQAGRHP